MDIYKSLYNSYYWVGDKLKSTDADTRKYLIIGVIVIIFLIYWNIGTIIWWGLLFVLGYYLYISQKKNVSVIDKELDDICRDKPELEICRIYNESKGNHKKIIESIKDKLSIHGE